MCACVLCGCVLYCMCVCCIVCVCVVLCVVCACVSVCNPLPGHLSEWELTSMLISCKSLLLQTEISLWPVYNYRGFNGGSSWHSAHKDWVPFYLEQPNCVLFLSYSFIQYKQLCYSMYFNISVIMNTRRLKLSD